MKLEEIRHVKVKAEMTLDQLIQEMRTGAGFGAKHLALATDIFMDMVKDKDCTIFLTVAGAMIPGGMKQVFIDLLELPKHGQIHLVDPILALLLTSSGLR